ncbi:hypothetical protein GCM10009780_43210 [Actinomadura alba]
MPGAVGEQCLRLGARLVRLDLERVTVALRALWRAFRVPGSVGEAAEEDLESLFVVLAAEPAIAHEGEQTVQAAPERLGERLQIVVPGSRPDRLPQLGEG